MRSAEAYGHAHAGGRRRACDSPRKGAFLCMAARAPRIDCAGLRGVGRRADMRGSRAPTFNSRSRRAERGRPGHDGDLWLLDLATNVLTRLTSDPGTESDPTWSPDERRIAFTAWRAGRRKSEATIFQKDLITGTEQQLLSDPPPPAAVLDDWSADGRWLIFRH